MTYSPGLDDEQHEGGTEVGLDEGVDDEWTPGQRPDARHHQHGLPGELDADADGQCRANRMTLVRVAQVVQREPSVSHEHENDHGTVITADMTCNLHAVEGITKSLADQSAGEPAGGKEDRPLPTVLRLVEPEPHPRHVRDAVAERQPELQRQDPHPDHAAGSKHPVEKPVIDDEVKEATEQPNDESRTSACPRKYAEEGQQQYDVDPDVENVEGSRDQIVTHHVTTGPWMSKCTPTMYPDRHRNRYCGMARMRPVARCDALDPHPRASVPGRDESHVNPTLAQVLTRNALS